MLPRLLVLALVCAVSVTSTAHAQLCEQGVVSACPDEGRRAHEASDAERALTLYRRGCEYQDEASCAGLVGLLAAEPALRAAAPGLSLLWLRRCEAGDAPACAELGRDVADGRAGLDAGAVARALGAACEREVASACTARGTLAGPRRRAAAEADFERACRLGDGRGCRLLAERLEARRADASERYALGCTHGDDVSCGRRGRRMERDDPSEALPLLVRGCDAGDLDTCLVLGRVEERLGAPAEAERAFLRVCDGSGAAEACGRLARLRHRRGEDEAAEPVLRTACQRGYAPACVDLGEIAAARGNPAEATAMYRRARAALERACRTDGAACEEAATLHRLGRGGAVSEARADALLARGCTLGGADRASCLALGLAQAQPGRARQATPILLPLCQSGELRACLALAPLASSRDRPLVERRACELGSVEACAAVPDGDAILAARAARETRIEVPPIALPLVEIPPASSVGSAELAPAPADAGPALASTEPALAPGLDAASPDSPAPADPPPPAGAPPVVASSAPAGAPPVVTSSAPAVASAPAAPPVVASSPPAVASAPGVASAPAAPPVVASSAPALASPPVAATSPAPPAAVSAPVSPVRPPVDSAPAARPGVSAPLVVAPSPSRADAPPRARERSPRRSAPPPSEADERARAREQELEQRAAELRAREEALEAQAAARDAALRRAEEAEARAAAARAELEAERQRRATRARRRAEDGPAQGNEAERRAEEARRTQDEAERRAQEEARRAQADAERAAEEARRAQADAERRAQEEARRAQAESERRTREAEAERQRVARELEAERRRARDEADAERRRAQEDAAAERRRGQEEAAAERQRAREERRRAREAAAAERQRAQEEAAAVRQRAQEETAAERQRAQEEAVAARERAREEAEGAARSGLDDGRERRGAPVSPTADEAVVERRASEERRGRRRADAAPRGRRASPPEAPADRAETLGRECETGDAAACERAGQLFRDGNGVTADVARALFYFELACGAYRTSACAAALPLLSPRAPDDRPRLARLHEPMCASGDAAACERGLALLDEPPAEPARPLAARLASRGCELGRQALCVMAGHAERAGWDAAPSRPRSVERYATACRADARDGCVGLHELCREGVLGACMTLTRACNEGAYGACGLVTEAP
jgi:hypothetical protein